LQIPEIQEKIIEIKDIARIPGFKTKVSLISHQNGVEPAGTVIGPRGSRIKAITEQIHNEKIEIIDYDDDYTKYVINVCSPAEICGLKVIEPQTPEERKQVILIAKIDKLALLIGKKGANVRLISQMLNADVEVKTVEEAHAEHLVYEKIDIKSFQQRQFDRTFHKYQPNMDMLSKISIDNVKVESKSQPQQHHSPVNQNKTKPASEPMNKFSTEQQIKKINEAKKMKDSILKEFAELDKEELMKELSSVDSSQEYTDISDDDMIDEKYSNYKGK